jgi:hypothetical protein
MFKYRLMSYYGTQRTQVVVGGPGVLTRTCSVFLFSSSLRTELLARVAEALGEFIVKDYHRCSASATFERLLAVLWAV